MHKTNKIKIKYILTIITIAILYSCKNKSRNNDPVVFEKNEFKEEKNVLEYSIFFYDTVQINKTYKGHIYFKNIFDTLNTKQGDRRFSLYYSRITSILDNSYPKLKKQVLDTFGAKNNHEIPIKFEFSNLGVNYIDGFIEDEILVPVKDDSTKVRIITQDARITFKVFVIDSVEIPFQKSKPYLIEKIKPGYL